MLTKSFPFFSSISLTTIDRGNVWHSGPIVISHAVKMVKEKQLNSPLLHTLLSSNGPLESLSLSSWRCKWCAWWWWWWWPSAKLWCKWCKWLLLLLLLLLAEALRSRGLCGDGDRPFSPRSRPKCSALPTLLPPPPSMSVIMKRERDGSTAIEPRCIGTVMPPTVPPFDVNSSAELLIVAVLVGLSPDECHWSTILTEFYWHAIHKNVSGFSSFFPLALPRKFETPGGPRTHVEGLKRCHNWTTPIRSKNGAAN